MHETWHRKRIPDMSAFSQIKIIEVIILSETDNLFKAYSVQEIATMLGIGKTKTRELLDSGILPVTKVGRQYFTSPASIQEFLKKNIGKQIFF